MISRRDHLREWLAERAPNTLARLPYSASLKLLEISIAAFAPMAEVWPRHSYVLGNFAPIRSDLDLTLWFPGNPSARDKMRALRIQATLRRCFPWWGELNCYAESEANRLAPFANPCTLLRDPTLLERLRPAQTVPSPAQRGVFLLRMLESDLRGLTTSPEPRREKWSFLFQIAGLSPPTGPLLPGLLLNRILDLVGFRREEIGRLASALKAYYAVVLEEEDIAGLSANDDLRSLLPHRFCFNPQPMPLLSETAQAVLRAQLCWELWGLQSQYAQIAGFSSSEATSRFKKHLSHLGSLVADQPVLADLQGHFEELGAWFREALAARY